MRNLIWGAAGLFLGLWLAERRYSQRIDHLYQQQLAGNHHPTKPTSSQSIPTAITFEKAESSPLDRSLEEISPTYGESVRQNLTIYDYPPSQVYDYLRKIVGEWVQPSLTPIERHTVVEKLVNLFHYGRRYDQHREDTLDKRTEDWLSDFEEDTLHGEEE